MSQQITTALTKLFEKHRLVFWYDTKSELGADFEGVELVGVEKLVLDNNEFSVKHRVLRDSPDQKFLLFKPGPQPEELDNWLLDVQLGHAVFRTDQGALWLSELELGLEFAELVENHAEFFKMGKRRDALKKKLETTDTLGVIRLKMLAVCSGADPRIDAVLESLLEDESNEQSGGFGVIQSCGLDGYLWEQLERIYGYKSQEPSVRDFVLELFDSCYRGGVGETFRLSQDALVFLRRWKDSRAYEESFEVLSDFCAEKLDIEKDLNQHRDTKDLLDLDYFRLVEMKIVSDLVRSVVYRTTSVGDIAMSVRQRRQSRWFGEFRHLYEAIDDAAKFVFLLDELVLQFDSLAEGVERYTASWFQVDQLYRKFVYHVRSSAQPSLLGNLHEQIENLYTNNFLLPLNDHWQSLLDGESQWNIPGILKQQDFFTRVVRPFLKDDKKVFVVISDAMRYEVGEELLSRIRQEDRYEAKLQPAVSVLPSYTQLGMAALLPNADLSIPDGGTATAFIDGKSTQGLDNRGKVLATGSGKRSAAVRAKDLMKMNRDQSRELTRDHDVVYVYHNLIDKTGDDRESEERVFNAAEDALGELIKLIKKLTGANASNILLTADHGFIYQDRVLDESDFTDCSFKGDEVLFRNRRFVIGKSLSNSPKVKTFSAEALGLIGDLEFAFPKSINRLRVKGSGSRFVHGGASLQEVVIPVLHVNKTRKSDVAAVEVDIVGSGSKTITSGQLAVVFYQQSPVTDKVQARELRAAIYTEGGQVISDEHTLKFDYVSDNTRERELKVRFVMSKDADQANGQQVILKLEEKVSGTSKYQEYKSIRYEMRRSFTSDFDF